MPSIRLYASRYGSLALSTNQQNAEVLKRDLSGLVISAVEKFGVDGAARLFAVAMDLYHHVKLERPLDYVTVGEYTPEPGDGTVLLAELEAPSLVKKMETKPPPDQEQNRGNQFRL